MNLCFFHLVLKQVNVVVVVIIFTIRMQNISDVGKNLKYLMLKYLIYYYELMKQDMQNGMKLLNVNVNVGLMLVIINNVRIKINADVNVKN